MKKAYAEKRYRKDKIVLLTALIFSVVIFLYSLFYTVIHFKNINLSSIVAVVVTITMFSLMTIVVHKLSNLIDKKLEKVAIDAERSKRGFEGENQARPIITESADSNDRVYFNKDLPKGGDVDCIVIGKRGVILLEIKNFQNRINLPSNFVKGFSDPRWEARKHSIKLNDYFKEKGFDKKVPFHMAVLYINPDVRFSGKQNGVYNICGLDKLKAYFDGLFSNNTLTQEDIDELCKLVESLD